MTSGRSVARDAAPDGRGKRGFIGQASRSSVSALGAMISGLLLDIAISVHFGAGKQSDAFFAASRIPIGVAALLTTVAVQAWVPRFVRDTRDNGIASLTAFASRMLTAITGICLLVWAVAWIFARPLMSVTAPGLSRAQLDLAASMVPVVFLIIPLVAAAEVVRGALNASYSFAVPAAMNVFLSLPAAAVVLLDHSHHIQVVARAYLVGGCAQLLMILVVAWRNGLRLHPSLRITDPRIRTALAFTGRPTLSSGLNLINRTAEQAIASFLPSGSITVLSYAQRLISALGGGTFFRPITVALLPRLADAEHSGDTDGAVKLVQRATRLVLGVSLVLTTFTIALADPVIRLVFHRGNFSAHAASLLAVTLAVYGTSLVGSGLQRVLLAPFYARLDTRTPLRNTAYGVLVDLVLIYPCMLIFGVHSAYGVVGVAVAYSLDQYFIVGHAYWRLKRTMPVQARSMGAFTARALLASTAAIVVMLVLDNALGVSGVHSRAHLLILTVVLTAAGSVVLAATGYAVADSDVRAKVRRKLRPYR